MGLASFWSNITGRRIQEISPQESSRWSEQSRPSTSSGARSVRNLKTASSDARSIRNLETTPSDARSIRNLNFSSIEFTIGHAATVQPATADEENQSIRKAGPRTLVKRKPQAASRGRNSFSRKRQDSMQASLEVPALPSVLSNENAKCSDLETTTSDESIIPGTAVTTDDAVTLDFFHFQGEGMPPPRLKHEAEYAPNLMARRRSKSIHLDRPRAKRASWLQRSKSNQDSDLPPLPQLLPISEGAPLSPSMHFGPSVPSSPSTQSLYSLPLSPMPISPATPRFLTLSEPDEPIIAELAAYDHTRWTRYSADTEDLLETFQLMPNPSQEATKQLQPSSPSSGRIASAVAIVPLPRRLHTFEQVPKLPHSQSATVTAVRPPSRRRSSEALAQPAGSRWEGRYGRTTGLSTTIRDEDDAEISMSEDQQRDHERTARIMDTLDQEQTNDATAMPGAFEGSADRYRSVWIEQCKYANEQALAALEFGPINEATAIECSPDYRMSLTYTNIKELNDSFDSERMYGFLGLQRGE
ncbi:hypothetical protein LTR37_014073 [Vermiconidia calcicola]|uniref:Uncharacterized protein n=1 Tax=Vermiconidia calcicola TaxID=1690605 RepID=A0ACC3MV97_9PEZI|nr:hypothetical protein LTR37_014073 [Vermiconidia calcicola]